MNFSVRSIYITIKLFFCLLATSRSTIAQSIQTDGTTPTLPETCSGGCTIRGGLKQGNNLFHSFIKLGVDTNTTVLFQDSGVANIFSRVTGNEMSEILGTLGVTGGDANLFLINPNGIFFGENSSLNVNGSFLATTANAISFEEQGFLNSTSDKIPILTINPSALVFASDNQGVIINKSTAPAGDFFPGFPAQGLQVPNGKSLLLVGGDIILDGGQLNAFGGRIELGGLAEAGEIKLNFSGINEGNISLDYLEQVKKSNTTVANLANIWVFSENKGDIAINAENLTVSGMSNLLGGVTESSETGRGQAGDIILNVTKKLEITDGSFVANQVTPNVNGNGGDIYVNSGSLFIENSSIITTTLGQGNSGNLRLNIPNGLIKISSNSLIGAGTGGTGIGGNIVIFAKEMILEDNSNIDASTFQTGNTGNIDVFVAEKLAIFSNSTIQNSIGVEATGDGGNINIEAKNLSLYRGSQLRTNFFGRGEGGSIDLDITDSVIIIGVGTNGFSTGITSAAEQGSEGNAGTINVNTKGFRIADGGLVSSQTASVSDGGDIIVNANTFEAFGGGQVVASADSSGNAGNINIYVSDNLLLSGSDSNFIDRLAVFEGSIEDFQKNIGNEAPGNSGFFASSRMDATGRGGNIEVQTNELEILDGAEINVSATGTGVAGSSNINAGNVTLDGGTLTAATRVGDRGNITISNADTLLLRNNSEITTNATKQATGGDININSDTIALLDFSSITANAVEGRGGNIQIFTEGIFREPNTIIQATSEENIDGTIIIEDPDRDPSSGVFELPNAPIDAATILSQNLCRFERGRIAKGSSFIITGRGGLTPTSEEPLSSSDVVGWANREDVEVSDDGLVGVRQRSEQDRSETDYPEIQQAQGWVTSSDGSVWLVANAPESLLQSSEIAHPDCSKLRQ